MHMRRKTGELSDDEIIYTGLDIIIEKGEWFDYGTQIQGCIYKEVALGGGIRG